MWDLMAEESEPTLIRWLMSMVVRSELELVEM